MENCRGSGWGQRSDLEAYCLLPASMGKACWHSWPTAGLPTVSGALSEKGAPTQGRHVKEGRRRSEGSHLGMGKDLRESQATCHCSRTQGLQREEGLSPLPCLSLSLHFCGPRPCFFMSFPSWKLYLQAWNEAGQKSQWTVPPSKPLLLH